MYVTLYIPYIVIRLLSKHLILYVGGGVDYDSGPYNVSIIRGNKEATFDVPIINDELYEFDEVFFLTILTSGLPPGYLRASPYTAIVGIHEDDCKLCEIHS